MMKMNLFTLAGLLIAIVCFLLAFFIFIHSRKKLHRLWALFNISVGMLGLGIFLVGTAHTYQQAFIGWKIAFIGIPGIGVFFCHVVDEFCQLDNRRMVRFLYIHGVLFWILVVTTNTLFHSMRYAFNQFYYANADVMFNVMFAIWGVFVVNAFINLFLYIRKAKGLVLTQGKYLFWGMLVGFLGGATTALPTWGIDVYPYWNLLICIYAALVSYAIFRYQLMDIRIVVTRLGVFIAVYAFVLGVPFGLAIWGKSWLMQAAGDYWFLVPMLILLGLATSGPFIYVFFQRRAEAPLLKEERTILEILKKAAGEIPHIKDIPHLLTFITQNLQKLSVNYVAIYLWDGESNSYNLKDSVTVSPKLLTVAKEDALVLELMAKKAGGLVHYLNYDEIQFLSKEGAHSKSHNIMATMQGLLARVIIPMVDDGSLLGFIVLGKRDEQKLYSQELMGVLVSIGALAGSAIADYSYWEKVGLEERRASLDHIASSMAHEIYNPITVISGQIEVLKIHLSNPDFVMPKELKVRMDKSMDFIIEACDRVTNTIRKIQEYSKGVTGQLKLIQLIEVEESYWTLMGPQLKKAGFEQGIEYTKEIEADLPYILGDKIRLEEVLINFANNALHAVSMSDIKKIRFKMFRKNDDWVRMEFSDTGYGIEKDLLKDIWLPHVTTKGSVEGTGLGLFIARKIIETHGGRAWAESAGTGHGATMIVELPVPKGSAGINSL